MGDVLVSAAGGVTAAPLPELANAVRRQVQHDFSTLTGLDVVEINILFTDLDVDEEG